MESRVKQSVFEGLLVHALKLSPDSEFAAALRAEGFDVTRQEPEYPSAVWHRCLEVACRFCYAERPRDEALRLLGERFIDGFFQTLVGKMAGALLPLLGPAQLLKRFTGFAMSSAPGLTVTVTQLGPRSFVVRYESPATVPDFDAAVVLGALAKTGVSNPQTTLTRGPEGFALTISW